MVAPVLMAAKSDPWSDQVFSHGNSLKNLAMVKENVHIMRLLIEWGTEVDSGDKWGWTPLHATSRFGHPQLYVCQHVVDTSGLCYSNTARTNMRLIDKGDIAIPSIAAKVEIQSLQVPNEIVDVPREPSAG